MIRIGDQLARRLRLLQLPRLRSRPRDHRRGARVLSTRWGTHPSWSRLLGSPVLYEQIEERLTRAARRRGRTRAADDHADPHVGDPGARRRRARSTVDSARAQDDLRGLLSSPRLTARPSSVSDFEDLDDLERLLSENGRAPRLICVDGVNSMTGNAPTSRRSLASPEPTTRCSTSTTRTASGSSASAAATSPARTAVAATASCRHVGESYDHVAASSRGLSKAYSSLAAFLACPTELKRLLKTAAPPYLYSGPSPVASLATTLAGLDVNERRGDAIRADLWQKTATRARVPRPPRRPYARTDSGFPIIEVPLGHGEDIDAVGRFLFENGDLRHARGLSARSEKRGRLPDSDHGGEHGRRDRASRRRARQAREQLRSPTIDAGGASGVSFRQACGNWRNHVWAWYLGAHRCADRRLPVRSRRWPGYGPLINCRRPAGRDRAIVVGILMHKPQGPGRLVAASSSASSSSSAATSTPTAIRALSRRRRLPVVSATAFT